MKHTIPYPFKAGARFATLEDLRRAVADLEAVAREYGVTAGEIVFCNPNTRETYCNIDWMLSLQSIDSRYRRLDAHLSFEQALRKD